MRIIILAALLATTACKGSSAIAADRGYSVQDFDRIRIEGPYDVQVSVGPAAAAHAHGPQDGIDRLDVSVNDGVLVIRTDHNGWGGWPGGGSDQKVTLTVSTPSLRGVALAGSGSAKVDHIKSGDVQLTLSGTGDINVGALEADNIALAVTGSGDLKVAGKAKEAVANLQGTGDLDASALAVEDATLTMAGSGDLKLAASRTAKVTSAGSGDVTVTGAAACTVSRVGSGDVTCGKGG